MKKKEIQNKIPNLIEVAKEAPLEIYPMLFNLVAVQHSTQKIMLYTRAHYTKEEAIEAFKIKITLKTGTPAETWLVKIATSISAEDLEKEFRDIADKVVVEKKTAKNKLMKQIIDNKDLGLLHRNYDRFTNHEISYMHEALTL